MEITVAILLFGVGLAFLISGGECLVNGATLLARLYRVSPFFAGVVLVGFGTSAPELFVSLKAALKNQEALALANVVGSNIANILLILGVTCVLSKPSRLDFSRTDIILQGVAMAFFMISGFFGRIEKWQGGLFMGCLFLGLFLSYRTQKQPCETNHQPSDDMTLPPSLTFFHDHVLRFFIRPVPRRDRLVMGFLSALGGLFLILWGAGLVVDNAIILAVKMGISETTIGLTMVALGTSLPELATALSAARKGETSLVFGNVLGSNLFNILGILGLTALAHPLDVPKAFLRQDGGMLSLATTLLMGLCFLSKTHRLYGVFFLGLYTLYIGLMAL